ncbi:MAG TPA: hypothetical protein VGE56_06740 [Rhodocyclaceae bacterium]|jgi:hypothetical protein
MKYLRSTLRLLATSIFLAATGCVPQIYHQQLYVLDKGMTSDQATTQLKQPPLEIHTASSGGRNFSFYRYRLNNGVQLDTYLLAFERDRLVYWGYVTEFRRQPDVDLSNALTIVMREASKN